jgi:hypothetical protein
MVRLTWDLAMLAAKHERTIWELMNDDRVVCELSHYGRARLMRAGSRSARR